MGWLGFGKGKKKETGDIISDIRNRKIKDTKAIRASAPAEGKLSETSLFAQRSTSPASGPAPTKKPTASTGRMTKIAGKDRSLDRMSTLLDPNPRARELWQRKRVMRMVRRKERLTPAEYVKKTEREVTVKSPELKTSVKKLMMLARQIQGKTLQEALIQMRFSKKKSAVDVAEHLRFARDKAIVSRGMGLGLDSPIAEGKEDAAKPAVQIWTKQGKRRSITDKSNIYIEQAWVGRGSYGKLPDYRARGVTNIMRTPWTHLTVRLKEEATLIREHKEREEKRRRQRFEKPWDPLPNRSIYGQQQYSTLR